MFNNVGAHWPSHLQLVPCPNSLTSALFCLNGTPLESCPDTLATQGGPSRPFASFCVICVLASCFLVCDWSFLHSKKPALLWPPVPGAEGSGHMDSTCHSERMRDPRALPPSSSKTDTDWWRFQMVPMECHGIPRLTGMPCVYISSDMQKILQGEEHLHPSPTWLYVLLKRGLGLGFKTNEEPSASSEVENKFPLPLHVCDIGRFVSWSLKYPTYSTGAFYSFSASVPPSLSLPPGSFPIGHCLSCYRDKHGNITDWAETEAACLTEVW